MILSLFYALLLVAFVPTDVPNYYPSYLKAREEAVRSHKNLLVFVSDSQCATCDAAWNAYTKDGSAVNRYVSTRIEKNDFDGGVIAEILDVRNTPAFVILDAQGRVSEKWEGGWKDASGNPTLFVQPAGSPSPASVPTPKTNTPVPSTSRQAGNGDNATPPVKTTTTNTAPVTETSKKETQTTPTSTPSHSSGVADGYVLQAGYFGSEANAQKCALDLESKGAGSFTIRSTQQNGTMYYRVVSSSFPTEPEAQKQLEKISSLGVKATIKKVSEL